MHIEQTEKHVSFSFPCHCARLVYFRAFSKVKVQTLLLLRNIVASITCKRVTVNKYLIRSDPRSAIDAFIVITTHMPTAKSLLKFQLFSVRYIGLPRRWHTDLPRLLNNEEVRSRQFPIKEEQCP